MDKCNALCTLINSIVENDFQNCSSTLSQFVGVSVISIHCWSSWNVNVCRGLLAGSKLLSVVLITPFVKYTSIYLTIKSCFWEHSNISIAIDCLVIFYFSKLLWKWIILIYYLNLNTHTCTRAHRHRQRLCSMWYSFVRDVSKRKQFPLEHDVALFWWCTKIPSLSWKGWEIRSPFFKWTKQPYWMCSSLLISHL